MRVTTRERGVIPGCYPADIQEYRTTQGYEACRYPPKQDRAYTPKTASAFWIKLERDNAEHQQET